MSDHVSSCIAGSVPALRDHWVSGIRPIVANTSDWITDFGEPIPSTRDFWQGGSLDYVYDNWLIEYPTYPMETEPCVVFYFPDFFLNNVPCVISLTYSICEKP
ncbi:hypothetical protein DPMN_119526 [Dreissena polymorpha]|uniref:Uncharacterized protein n=1 Tax=Dreissena polymorpha TaxID=45954 RepID=A0A9D4JMS2_DREPO|nr:hypothetical protein DPMN_119526 [Dreissena polymorpha]